MGGEAAKYSRLSQGDFRNYIYPVFTPSGVLVTSESPIDHPHHQSVTIGADHFNCYLPYSSDKVEEANYSFYVNYVIPGACARAHRQPLRGRLGGCTRPSAD